MPETERHRVKWDIIKVIRKNKTDDGMTSAIHIRQGITDNGRLSFSYMFGVYSETEHGERWIPYSFIPDRYAFEYIELFQDAVSRVHRAMRDAQRTNGKLTALALEESVRREIRRRR
jgi:hypothetical protein